MPTNFTRGAWEGCGALFWSKNRVALAVGNVRIRNERNQRELALKEKGAALDTARQSEEQARKQLFISLKSQAQARRYSAHMGQRVESLSALAEAARIKPDPALRD